MGGINTYRFMKEHLHKDSYNIKCFADNNPLKWGTYLEGIKVLPINEAFSHYNGEAVIISCGEGDEILNQLKEYGVPVERVCIPDVSVLSENDVEFIKSNLKKFERFYDDLSDEKSKCVLTGLLNYKLTHNLEYIQNIADDTNEQYFDPNLIKYTSDDVFVDCGAYTGDTAEIYVKYNDGKYKEIICFEADKDNCSIIRKNCIGYNIRLENLACWNEKTELMFDKVGSGSGAVIETNKAKHEMVSIMADTIDHVLNGNKATFIKMDIEGAEYKALIGAVDTIQRYKPTLMISVYHKQDDLIRLPMLIYSMNQDYSFYLRHYRRMSMQETVLYAL
jgi:FkbM family methyltransferase